ncbi:MAG: hypothetical protein R3E41_14730 [Burkholderiaceae bacterium]
MKAKDVLSPRPSSWHAYLAEGPAAPDDFMEGVEDLPLQERALKRGRTYLLDTDTCSYVMKRSNAALPSTG